VGRTASSLEGALQEYRLLNGPCDPIPRPNAPFRPLHLQNDLFRPLSPPSIRCEPLPPLKRGPVYNVPVEILIRISQLVAPPCTRLGLYDLSKLTHVCRFWREALMNQPRLWSTVFITQQDRRSFVEACLERSHPVALEVTVEASNLGKIHSDCTCDKKPRLLPNDFNPCEYHFQFELLAETKHSNRVRALDIEFNSGWSTTGKVRLLLGSCRFFTSTFPRLVCLTWKNFRTTDADYLFSTPLFVPTLRSLTYSGGWNSLIKQVTNLTSFSFFLDSDYDHEMDTEAFRILICNNRSLESLELKYLVLVGDSKGPPVHLLNLKSLTVGNPSKKLSTTIRIPAFQHLSSLRISSGSGDIDMGTYDDEMYTLHAAGDDITIKASCSFNKLAETWEDLTGYAKPIIRHIRLYDGPEFVEHECWNDNSSVVLLMMDAQTLEVGSNYLLGWYKSFWEELKQLGTQLKTIRFEVSEDTEPCHGDDCAFDDCYMWGHIEDLVKHRFEQGRPFSAVERMVVSEDDRENRLQAYVWRCFYGVRKLDQYIRPVQTL
jgi:hypothetical protein